MYQNYLAFAILNDKDEATLTAVNNTTRALAELDSNAFLVREGPDLEPEMEQVKNEKGEFVNNPDGTPQKRVKMQPDGLNPVMRSLDNQFTPIVELDKGCIIEFHTSTILGTNGPVDLPHVSNAFLQVFNRYTTIASMNQSIDDQNTLAEKHKRLKDIKPLEDNPPRRVIVVTDEKPHSPIELRKMLGYMKRFTEESHVCNGTDLKAVLIVVSEDPGVLNFYSELKQQENIHNDLVLIAKDGLDTVEKAKLILSNLIS